MWLRTDRKLRSGWPAQFLLISLNRRWSMGFHLEGAAGVLIDGDLEVVRVGEARLECILEATDARRVAAAGVGEHQQALRRRSSVSRPSRCHHLTRFVGSEVGGVVGGADDHEAAIGAQVVDAVGDGDAVGLGAEVVVVDGLWRSFPSGALVLEVAD